MNKAHLVETLVKDKSIGFGSRAAAERTVNAFFGALGRGIKKDKSVQIIGFGTFTVRSRKARTGRNPQTGAAIKIKASKTVGFKPSASLKASL